ncbi:hypothetical protein VN1328_03830 [Helicobacter pylori]
MSDAHSVENTNTEKRIFQIRLLPPPHNNEEPLNNDLKDLTDRFKKLEDKLEDLEPLIKIFRCIRFCFGKSSNDTQENSKDPQRKGIDSFNKKFYNDTQENSKDAQKKEEALKGIKEENIKLNKEKMI